MSQVRLLPPRPLMHEQSNTIQGRDGRWYNVYGTGDQPMPLPRIFGFEQPSYPTESMASNRAAWRSHMGDGQYPTTAPTYGFTNSYTPSPQAQAVGAVIDALRNPNSYYSTINTPLGPQPMILGPGFLGTLESGGFRAPLDVLRKAMGVTRENRFKFNPPGGEGDIRAGYLKSIERVNEMAKQLPRAPLFRRVDKGSRDVADLIANTRLGQVALEQEKLNRMLPSSGGRELPEEMKKFLQYRIEADKIFKKFTPKPPE